MSKYLGGRFIGNEPIQFGGSGRIANPGDVCSELPEDEAIGRHDFEPVYENDEVKIKQKSQKRSEEE